MSHSKSNSIIDIKNEQNANENSKQKNMKEDKIPAIDIFNKNASKNRMSN